MRGGGGLHKSNFDEVFEKLCYDLALKLSILVPRKMNEKKKKKGLVALLIKIINIFHFQPHI